MEDRYRVLIVDDEEDVHELLPKYANVSNVEYISAMNGKEALAICRSENIDVLVTDICMPEMDGMELCKRLKEEKIRVVPIVITGYGHFEDAKRAYNYDVMNFISKPLDWEVLVEILKRALKMCKLNKLNVDLIVTLSEALGLEKIVSFEKMNLDEKMKIVGKLSHLVSLRMSCLKSEA